MRKLAMFLAIAMAVTTIGGNVFIPAKNASAASATKKEQKKIGLNTLHGERVVNSNLNYELKNGVLTVSGTGIVDNSYRTQMDVNKINEIVLEPGVTAIGDYAFYKLKNLKKISIPDTVTELGTECLAYLEMDRIEIPKSVKILGKKCMQNGAIKTVIMPGKFEKIYNHYNNVLPQTKQVYLNSTFSPGFDKNCLFTNAQKVYTAKNDKKYKNFGDCIYTKNGKKLVFVPTSVKTLKVRKGCKDVSMDAFNYGYEGKSKWLRIACKKLKTIKIPSSVETFSSERIHHSDGMCYKKKRSVVGKCKFEFESKNLSGYIIAALNENGKNEYLSEKYGVTKKNGMYISKDHGLVYYDGKGKKLKIPSSVKCIAPCVFDDDRNLEKIVVPSSVKKIGDFSFLHLWMVKEIILPDSVQSIGDGAFADSCHLKKINLPKNLKSIGKEAFYSTSVTNIKLPNSVKKCGEGCFEKCDSLKKITLSKRMKEIPDHFCSWTKIKELKLPENVKKIGDGAFVNCPLKEIIFPQKVKSIGKESFSSCNNLSKVKFNSKLECIGEGAFEDTKLSEVTIPGNVKSVGASAFTGDFMTDVKLENGVERINETSFINTKYSEQNKGENQVEYNEKLIKISAPKSLKYIMGCFENMQADIKETIILDYSANAKFNDSKRIQLSEKNTIVDVSALEKGSKLYCKFTHVITRKGKNKKTTYTISRKFYYSFK